MIRHEARGEGFQRWGSILVGIAVLFVTSWMTYAATNAAPLKVKDEAGVTTSASSTSSSSSTKASPQIQIDASAASIDLDAGLSMPMLSLDAALLPSSAPRHVKLGVVLVSYQGAEGAPPNARNKRDAQALADKLGLEAKSDFSHAVGGGDSGSSSDIGRIPRGVLDPRTEAAVFALSAGEISDVLETPKGFWIVKRIE